MAVVDRKLKITIKKWREKIHKILDFLRIFQKYFKSTFLSVPSTDFFHSYIFKN